MPTNRDEPALATSGSPQDTGAAPLDASPGDSATPEPATGTVEVVVWGNEDLAAGSLVHLADPPGAWLRTEPVDAAGRVVLDAAPIGGSVTAQDVWPDGTVLLRTVFGIEDGDVLQIGRRPYQEPLYQGEILYDLPANPDGTEWYDAYAECGGRSAAALLPRTDAPLWIHGDCEAGPIDVMFLTYDDAYRSFATGFAFGTADVTGEATTLSGKLSFDTWDTQVGSIAVTLPEVSPTQWTGGGVFGRFGVHLVALGRLGQDRPTLVHPRFESALAVASIADDEVDTHRYQRLPVPGQAGEQMTHAFQPSDFLQPLSLVPDLEGARPTVRNETDLVSAVCGDIPVALVTGAASLGRFVDEGVAGTRWEFLAPAGVTPTLPEPPPNTGGWWPVDGSMAYSSADLSAVALAEDDYSSAKTLPDLTWSLRQPYDLDPSFGSWCWTVARYETEDLSDR